MHHYKELWLIHGGGGHGRLWSFVERVIEREMTWGAHHVMGMLQ
jgi:hypothetical protein